MVDKKTSRGLTPMVIAATFLAFIVVVLGAYTRLTDAGLGCPDWPGCYGQLIPHTDNTNLLMNTTKAWTEMIHRYLAGSLGLVIFVLTFFIIKNKSVFKKQSQILTLAVSMLVIFQALLGMWTVTLKLFPVVVMAHLLGGLTTLSLLWWLTLTLKPSVKKIKQETDYDDQLRLWSIIGLVMLVIQILLGGWVSANYAALVCLSFPFCENSFQGFQNMHFLEAFNFSHSSPLDLTERITIHMLHRMGAVLTTLIIGWLALLTWIRSRNNRIRKMGIVIAIFLVIQILLGITNILAVLPLPIAVAHNAVAALLLLNLVTLNCCIYEKQSF